MSNIKKRIDKYSEIYWTTHFLFFLIIITVFTINYLDDGNRALGQINILWIVAYAFFLIINALYFKAIKERVQSHYPIKYQLLYSLMLLAFAIIFSYFLHIYLPALQFIYLFFIILVSITCTIKVGVGTAILMGGTNVLCNAVEIKFAWLIFAFYALTAWVVGKISQANLEHAQQLEQQKKFLEGIINTLTEGIIITSADGVVTLCNDEVGNLFQLNNADIIGKEEKNIVKMLDLPSDRWLQQPFNNREFTIGERNYLVSRTYIQREERYTVIVINDITALTEQKAQAETIKLYETLGELANGVAHEVRNPLTTIRGFIQLAAQDLKSTSHYPLSQMAMAELDRVDWLINGLMQMIPQKTVAHQRLDLNEIVNKAWNLYNRDGFAPGISYQQNLSAPLPLINGSGQQLQQLILNLMQNASQACQQGNTITIKTYLNEKQEVCLDISDDGIGIAPEELAKITIPFYKKDFARDGLGLAICNRIVSDHKGFLTIESQLHVGTTVTVRLPQAS